MFLQLSQTIAAGASTSGQFPRGKIFEARFPAIVEGRRVISVLLSLTRERCGQRSSLRLGGLDLGVVVRPMVFSNQRINKSFIYEQDEEAFCEPCDAQK